MDLTKKDLVMTSRELAELTNKEHKNVIRDIRKEKEKLEMEGISAELIFGTPLVGLQVGTVRAPTTALSFT